VALRGLAGAFAAFPLLVGLGLLVLGQLGVLAGLALEAVGLGLVLLSALGVRVGRLGALLGSGGVVLELLAVPGGLVSGMCFQASSSPTRRTAIGSKDRVKATVSDVPPGSLIMITKMSSETRTTRPDHGVSSSEGSRAASAYQGILPPRAMAA